jgi:hypothetical protein
MYWLPSGLQINLYPKYDKQLAARWVVATVIAVFDIGNQTILFSLPTSRATDASAYVVIYWPSI